MVQDFLCFDTESAQGRHNHRFTEELLELSIMNAAHDEVYYSRFKPARLSKWDTKVHHITPAMVVNDPKFAECRAEVQRIFDSAKYIVGFSLIDDFKAVGNVGIENLDKKKRVELRHLYWYCIGRHEDVPFYSGPGLSACAERLGVKVDADAVHSATGDTKVTLDLFFALMNMFAEQHDIAGGVPDADSAEFMKLVDNAIDRIAEAKVEYDRKMAKGFIHVITHENGGYRFVPSVNRERENNDAVVTIEVNARKRAAFELERMFEKRRILNTKNFKLTKADLDTIKDYTNEFDNQESMYQRLLGLQRSMGGGKL